MMKQTLQTVEVSELDLSNLFLFLKSGVTFASFRSFGTSPVFKDLSKINW